MPRLAPSGAAGRLQARHGLAEVPARYAVLPAALQVAHHDRTFGELVGSVDDDLARPLFGELGESQGDALAAKQTLKVK